VTTKDPFRYQGIAVTVKTGVNHLGTDAHDPALYSDLQLRYAKAFNDRFAFKVNVGYLSGDDWLITDSSDIYKDVTADERGSDNPARDAVNIYGDEVARVDWVTDTAGAKVDVSRTGYDATELIDNSSYSAKINTALYYKLNDRLQLSYDFNYAKATTSYSSLSFFNLKNISMYTNKLELTGPRFFIRTAAVFNDLGDTYNASVLATAINKDWQPDTDWFNAYKQAYYGEVDGVTSYDFNAARNYADSGRLFPGTDAFNQVMETQKSIPFSNGGAKVIDRSSRYIAQGEYDFSYLIKVFDLIAGADYRLTRLNSEGTIFIDEPGEPLYINQYAGYAQATKQIFKDRLKLLAALRYDKADNFKGVWAPRFAAVYHPDNQNYFRASYQQGFRLPDPQLQFIDIVLSNRHRLGGTAVVDAPYHSRTNSFTGSSVTEFKDSINKFLVTHPNQLDSAVNRFQGILQKSSYDYIQPEKVRTFEVGYRRLLGDEKIYADINYFHNNYSGFIYSTVLVVTDSGGTQNAAAIDTAGHAIYAGGVENFQTVVNAADKVLVNGIEIGTSILLPKGYILSGNLTWIHSSVKPGEDEPGIRTPPLKSNLAISNSDLIKNLGFMINWRWTDAINNWSNVSDDKSIDNSLPAYSIIDAQVSYHLPKAATTIKAGASNLLNYYHQDFAQGISVGGIYYVSLTYDGIFK
ncbi:MAG: TonB-dependent receptor, partial [Chitinophagales bacterium]